MNSKSDAAVPLTEQQRLSTTIDNWKRKLLDTSKRNRALNFKVQRVSTVTIVDELPSAVFSKLWIEGASLRFAAAESQTDETNPTSDGVLEDDLNGDEQTVSTQQLDMALSQPVSAATTSQEIYAGIDSDNHYYDNVLQTSAAPDKLDKSLRRLEEQTRLAIEEQGVNLLFLALGMLHYKESADSSEVLKAPLVLLPVELTRKSARTGYVLSAVGEEALVNPALAEYLRRSHGLELPDLPDPASMSDDYDLQTLLDGVGMAVRGHKEWIVKNEIHLGIFSFQKFVMYKDVEQGVAKVASHRLVRQLILRNGVKYDGLPPEIRALDLDQTLPPERTFQVVDADSSQLRAIAAVAKNYDLVMEGPPGTGKSQTITNLIALALAAGKTVLFVAEKNAALKVVHQRISKVGLADFCLELHSTKANKRSVIRELARSLDASLQKPVSSATTNQRLPVVRDRLTEYVRQLHKPFGDLGLSPYRVLGMYGSVINAPRVKYTGTVETLTQIQIEQAIRELTELAEAAVLIRDPRLHPWRDTTRLYYTEDDFEFVGDMCRQILTQLENVYRITAQIGDLFGKPAIQSPGELGDLLAVAEVIARSPGAPAEVLSSTQWDMTPPEAAMNFVRQGKDLQTRVQAMNQLFKPAVFDVGHSPDITFVAAKPKGSMAFVAMLDGHYRSIRRRWLGYRLPGYHGSLQVQAEQLKQIDRINLDRKQLAEQSTTAQGLFGNLWRQESTDWTGLESYVAWVVEFRGVFQRYNLGPEAIETAQMPSPNLSAVQQLQTALNALDANIRALGERIGWPEGYLVGVDFSELGTRVRGLAENLPQAHAWATFESVRTLAENGLAGELVKLALTQHIAFADLAPAFLRAVYQKWLIAAVQARKPLLEFNTLLHEQRVTEFKDLDRKALTDNLASLIGNVRNDIQRKLQTDKAAEAMPFLRKEIARQRGQSPLRRTMKHAGPAIRAIKPCFMMSPLTVAQLLDSSQPEFDLVIFDEASQLPVEDAIGAIYRGKQLVVVGDPKQLPPTNFFGVMSGQVSAALGEDGLPIYEDGESVLEELSGAGLPRARLLWHYRSAHESLIQFSNVLFYDSELYTFPSVEFAGDDLGVSFEYVGNGVYEGHGLNLAEARRVVDAVVLHAKTSPQLSLGVGTFNMRQQLAIQDEVESRRRLDPGLDAFCSQSDGEPFFVKNLENIQGDERDVIFISVTYGKGLDGRLRYNFGPINGENGWRRLNVLASRARRRMRVFSSIRADDISPVGLTSAGAKLLRSFLLYAESGRFDLTDVTKVADTESPFEREVYQELVRNGLSVVPQVGVAGYRIDLAVVDDALPGRYICGIECDGVTYHASETARDRDRLRQQVLEERGWLIYRIWSTDWFKDRAGQVARILELIQQARVKVTAEVAARPKVVETRPGGDDREDAEGADSGDRIDQTLDALEENLGATPMGYVRPIAAVYQFAGGSGALQGHDILQASQDQLARAAVAIVKVESPIHVDDLINRIVGLYGTKAGRRIVERIKEACDWTVHRKVLVQKGNFYFSGLGQVAVRSRSGQKVTPDRISPEEYSEAILLVLRTGHVFPRKKLTIEVRTVLGFGRTSAALEGYISQEIDTLLVRGIAGEASSGITLRG